MPNRSSSSGSQRSVRRFMSMVRLALEGSVTWAFPPVSRQARKVSMVPKASSPFWARALAPFTWSRSQASLVAEK